MNRSLPIPKGKLFAVEWRTLAVYVLTICAWAMLVVWHAHIPWPLLMLAAGAVLCLYGSLQHEAIHGHPTTNKHLNFWLVATPLSVWLPFEIYRQEHLRHHASKTLTQPDVDPESFYVSHDQWARLSLVTRLLLSINQTLFGRLLLGPFITVCRFAIGSAGHLKQGGTRKIWLHHFVVATTLLLSMWWLVDLNPIKYIACFVYPGLSLTLLRSFAEHQRGDSQPNKDPSVIVASQSLLSLLYLNNNLHWLHHRQPQLAWYVLPAQFRALSERELEGITVYAGYWELVRRFALRRRDRCWY